MEEAEYLVRDRHLYTEASFRAFEQVFETAQEVANNSREEEMHETATALCEAMDGLILVENYKIGNVITSDGINIKDATAIQKHVSSLINFDETQLRLADTDGNKVVNVKDATAVQKYLAGLLTDCIIGQVPTDPEPVPDPEKYAYIDIGGVRYKACVGDTISYVVELQADKFFENIQAVVNYDSDKLELIRIYSDDPDIEDWEVEGEVRCPNFEMVFFNADFEDEVRFNASNIRGYDFTEEKTLVTLDFVVKSTERSEISLDVEYMTVKGDGSQKYFYNSEAIITDGISIREYAPMYHIHEVCPNEGVN